MTEEDLVFIKNHISEDVVNEEAEYYEDFQSQGLMSLRNGGYIYTMRAFLFRNYALAYEEKEIWPTKDIPGRPADFELGGGRSNNCFSIYLHNKKERECFGECKFI